MERFHTADRRIKKKGAAVNHRSERPLTTALFLLRATELGLSMSDLECLEMGTVLDMLIERQNDQCDYAVQATADDIAAF